MVDKHCSRLAQVVSTQPGDKAGCAVNYGPTSRFDRRPCIEGIFKKLEASGFVRLPSTTDSHPHDPRRRDPAKAATKHSITLRAMLDLIEEVIAHYNATHITDTSNTSPLDKLLPFIQKTNP